MPIFGLLMLASTVIGVVHAARSGRFWPWAYVIILLPGFGVAAYFLFEVMPELRRAPATRKAQAQLVQTLDPGRRYRALKEELAFTDTIGTREDLAQECLALGKYDEALELYDGIIQSPQGDEPYYFLGKAKAEYALQRPGDTLTTLDRLQSQWPKFHSQEAHLLYARALEDLGRLDEALREYDTLVTYYAGAEAKVRRMHLLHRLGRTEEAKHAATDVIKGLERSPKFARKQQAQWLTEARTFLKG